MDSSATVFWTIAVQILGAGIIIGMYRQMVIYHAEKFTDHQSRIKALDEEKLDKVVHEEAVKHLDGDIGAVSHRVSNVDQRLVYVERTEKK